MHDFWTIPTINVVVGEHEIQTLEVVVVVLLFLLTCHLIFLSSQVHIPYYS